MSKVVVKFNNLGRLAGQADDIVGDQIQQGADNIADRYRGLVHVLSGQTKESIESRAMGRTSAEVTAEHGALFEELGTDERPPHPAAIPAFNQTVPDIERGIVEEIVRAAGK